MFLFFLFFFFQAEDGTRDRNVTGVQTCALPIFAHQRLSIIDLDARADQPFEKEGLVIIFNGEIYNYQEVKQSILDLHPEVVFRTSSDRSEERRVGKECRCMWVVKQYKKKKRI